MSPPISLMGNQDAGLSATVTFGLDFKPTGTLGVRVSPDDWYTPFDRGTQPVTESGGLYTVQLPVFSSDVPGVYRGTARLMLCADAYCTVKQAAPEMTVTYAIDVLPVGTSWPGDHLTPLSAWADAPEWGTFQGNMARTGFVPVDIDPSRIQSRWRLMASGPAIPDYNGYPQTVAVEKGVFYQSGGSVLEARRESDASLLWRHDFVSDAMIDATANPPTVQGGTVYVGVSERLDARLFALDASTGATVFRGPMSSQGANFLPPAVGPSGVYEGGGTYGGLYGFALGTGVPLFFHEVQDEANMWSPAVDGNAVYDYARGRLLAIDPVSGGVLAEITDASLDMSGYGVVGSPVLGASGRVYAAPYEDSIIDGGTRGNVLHAFDVPGGGIAWEISGNFPSTPAYHAGHLYVANENPFRIESRAEADGALEWSWTPPPEAGSRFRSEVLLTNRLFFVSTDTTTYAVDLATRQVVWSFPMSGHLALSRNGILYIQNPFLTCAFNVK